MASKVAEVFRLEPSNVESLYSSTLSLYQVMVKNIQSLNIDNIRCFKDQLGQLYLWGENFSDGKLGNIVREYHQLGLAITKLLANIATDLYGCLAKSSFEDHPEMALVAQKVRETLQAIEPVHLERPLREDNEESEDTGSLASDELEESVTGKVKFYVGLLMNLVPSMEHALCNIEDENGNLRGSLLLVAEAKPGITSRHHFSTEETKGKEALRKELGSVIDIDNDEWSRGLLRNIDYEMHDQEIDQTKESSMELPSHNLSQERDASVTLDENDHRRFRNSLMALSEMPLRYENPGLLDEALLAIPLDRIYAEAQEETDLFQAQAISASGKPTWGYQDCIARALLRWFKRDFFTWVTNPICHRCAHPTVPRGHVVPTAEEVAFGALRVELYKCINDDCEMSLKRGGSERFPRYGDVWKLLETRRGRAGEWANCFTMLCRALGCRVRWVWNAEDHVWTEVWSELNQRWVHADPCEELWDAPLCYTEGWRKKMSYIIAFSAEGVTDVTRRYVRTKEHALPRTRCSEQTLQHMISVICQLRRKDLPKMESLRLVQEDVLEEKEFHNYTATALSSGLSRLLPSAAESKESSVRGDQKGMRIVGTGNLTGTLIRPGN